MHMRLTVSGYECLMPLIHLFTNPFYFLLFRFNILCITHTYTVVPEYCKEKMHANDNGRI